MAWILGNSHEDSVQGFAWHVCCMSSLCARGIHKSDRTVQCMVALCTGFHLYIGVQPLMCLRKYNDKESTSYLLRRQPASFRPADRSHSHRRGGGGGGGSGSGCAEVQRRVTGVANRVLQPTATRAVQSDDCLHASVDVSGARNRVPASRYLPWTPNLVQSCYAALHQGSS